MNRILGRAAALTVAGVGYVSFLLVLLWSVGFLADLPWAPTTVDGPVRAPAAVALLVDLLLLLAFSVHHSVMARAGVKRRLARQLPPAVERGAYVLASSALLGLVLWQWQPVPGSVWRASSEPWAAMLWALCALGWVLAVASTFVVDHWDFVGLRQARWDPRRGAYRGPGFTERWLYAWVRHPLMLGLLVAFWATPRMTLSHLVFAVGWSCYIAVGVHFEERDLRRSLGATYDDYAERVPAVLPRPRRRAAQPLQTS